MGEALFEDASFMADAATPRFSTGRAIKDCRYPRLTAKDAANLGHPARALTMTVHLRMTLH
jgi:hypothetical protein